MDVKMDGGAQYKKSGEGRKAYNKATFILLLLFYNSHVLCFRPML